MVTSQSSGSLRSVDMVEERKKGGNLGHHSVTLANDEDQRVLAVAGARRQGDTRVDEGVLMAELQRRCDRIIELEVLLDRERERANRLERTRREGEAALSDELRDVMGTVCKHHSVVNGDNSSSKDNNNNNDNDNDSRRNHPTIEPRSPVGVGENSSGGARDREFSLSPVLNPSWEVSSAAGGDGGDGGLDSRGEMWADRARQQHQKQQQQQGALRARVLELELDRQEAVEALKVKTDRSLRLEVQVEQLKNVVQSLSNATPGEGTESWGSASTTSTSKATPGTAGSFPLLRDTPGVDPSVMLLLHRTPWAAGVSEGVRQEEAIFEWQGRDSRGKWGSSQITLPAALTSLPAAGPSPPPTPPTPVRARTPTSQPPSPPQLVTPDGSPSTPRDRYSPEVAQIRSDGRSSPRFEGLKGRIGEVVAGLGGTGAQTGKAAMVLREGGTGLSLVTDEGVTRRFALDDVQLPSDHWEWIAGWMPDTESQASTDADGWVYGNSPSEIAEKSWGNTAPNDAAFVPLNESELYRNGGSAGTDPWNSPQSALGAMDGGLRRRRLVRMRMLTKVDGAKETTTRFLEMLRRMSSMEILVRKLSHQILILHRQVTTLEGQVASLAPLEPKLRQACAMGRRDRHRGDQLHRRLVEAQNEIKVLKRCMGSPSCSPPPPSPAGTYYPMAQQDTPWTLSGPSTPIEENASTISSPICTEVPRSPTRSTFRQVQERGNEPGRGGDLPARGGLTVPGSGAGQAEGGRRPWGWMGGGRSASR